MNHQRPIHSHERSPRPHGGVAGPACSSRSTHATSSHPRSLGLTERLLGPDHHQLVLTLFAQGRIDHEVL
jgi:hypothetical protein